MTSVRSILDKPLAQLTEDDISQLTREDCRKFLKDKGKLCFPFSLSLPPRSLLLSFLYLNGRLTRGGSGMRRPSWNKSQAIQQVISLKALLEGGDDDDSGTRANLRKIVVSAAAAADENPPPVREFLVFKEI